MTKQDTNILQYWLKEVITTPGSLQNKLHKANHLFGLNEADIVSGNDIASPYERLNVYSSGYVLRLMECLSADFPVLKKFLGDEVFNAFAKASLVFSPPVSYTLYDLGKNFITFLETTRPQQSSAGYPADDLMLDLPIEMAKLERARQEAIRAHGTEQYEGPIPVIDTADILFQPGGLLLSIPECVRLLELKFRLKDFFTTVSADNNDGLPEAQQTYMAVSRKNYHITMEALTLWQYIFLKTCHTTPILTNALNETAATTGISPAAILAELCIWLPVFLDKGFLVISRNSLEAAS